MNVSGFESDTRLTKIEADLSRPWYRLGLSGPLERQWLENSWASRAQVIFFWHVFSIPTNVLLLLVDHNADVLEVGLAVRLGLIVPFYIFSLFLLSNRSPALGFVSRVLPFWVMTGGISTISLFTAEQDAGYYQMGISMMLLFTALAVPHFFRHMVMILVGAYVLNMIILISAQGDTGQRAFDSTIHIVVISSGLAFSYLRAMQTRNEFLMTLRDEIKTQQLSELTLALISASETDELTGLKNRRGLYPSIAKIRADAKTLGGWINVYMIDVDHFKSFNDTAGHAAGDECLKKVASALSHNVDAEHDLIARYGGEEFLAAIRTETPEDGQEMAEKLRASVETLRLKHPSQPQSKIVTVSVGYTQAPAGSDVENSLMFLASDRALYDAKTSGRNRIRFRAISDIDAIDDKTETSPFAALQRAI